LKFVAAFGLLVHSYTLACIGLYFVHLISSVWTWRQLPCTVSCGRQSWRVPADYEPSQWWSETETVQWTVGHS